MAPSAPLSIPAFSIPLLQLGADGIVEPDQLQQLRDACSQHGVREGHSTELRTRVWLLGT